MDAKKKPTLMIVDDEPINLQVLAKLLQPYYQVRAAVSGPNAFQIMAKPPLPELILLDVMMPDMDGYTVLQHLHERPEYREIPVIFITALCNETDEKRGFELGAVDYITKPIRPSIVLARIAAQLELKLARDRLKEQNGWLEKEVQRRMREKSLVQDITLTALAELAEERDSDTGHHIQRTQSYVAIMTRHLSNTVKHREYLTETKQHQIVNAAPLHDIGKVGIKDSILLKPGRLTVEEFEIMKTHSRIGGNTIDKTIEKALSHYNNESDQDMDVQSSLDFLATAKEIALHHHERWDGSGYPDGLTAEEIPLSARLMALADVYDAMTSKRPYKPALSHESTMQHIFENSGSHFEPDVVTSFKANQETFDRIRKSLSEPETEDEGKSKPKSRLPEEIFR